MAVRTKPYFPLDQHSKDIDDGWVLPNEPNFGSSLFEITPVNGTSQPTVLDVVAEDGWGITADAEATQTIAESITKVNINSAGVDELCEVPGIGPLRARRILALRDKNGPFSEVSELSAVKGLGKKSLEQLRPHLTV